MPRAGWRTRRDPCNGEGCLLWSGFSPIFPGMGGRFFLMLAYGFSVALPSCESRSGATSPVALERDEVEAKLQRITGLEIPDSATSVSGSEMSMFTHVFDCGFECAEEDLENVWKEAQGFVGKEAVGEWVPVDEGAVRRFGRSWSADGGTQFVEITLEKLEADRVRVEVRCTHE